MCSYVDPLIRAEFLMTKVLEGAEDLTRIPALTQDRSRGITYHFLHPALRKTSLKSLFRDS